MNNALALVLTTILFSGSYGYGASLLEVTAYSGFVPPEYVYSAECQISESGLLHRKKTTGVNPSRTVEVTRPVGRKNLSTLQKLIAETRAGIIEQSIAPADIPGFVLMVRDSGASELRGLVYRDSDGHQSWNNSPKTQVLTELVKNLCKLND